MPPSDSEFRALLSKSLNLRRSLIDGGTSEAFRAFCGLADGLDGVFVDVYGAGATLIVYEGRAPREFDAAREATVVLDALRPLGVTAVYLKPFTRDRSRLGGEMPEVVLQPKPAAGETLAEAIVVREYSCSFEIRLYDGLSTGLFLDQRDNRKFLHDFIAQFKGNNPSAVLNTFAYTCAFSVAAALAGARTTSVDVSPRYLEWGKRNFAHNGIDVVANDEHRFAKMDTFEFFSYARRKQLRYDVIVLDPPSFGSGSKKKKIRPWSSEHDYHRLVREASTLLTRGGMILASTNTQALSRPGRLEREVVRGIGRSPRWIDLPPVPSDFARDADRFAACAFQL